MITIQISLERYKMTKQEFQQLLCLKEDLCLFEHSFNLAEEKWDIADIGDILDSINEESVKALDYVINEQIKKLTILNKKKELK